MQKNKKNEISRKRKNMKWQRAFRCKMKSATVLPQILCELCGRHIFLKLSRQFLWEPTFVGNGKGGLLCDT